MENLSPVRDEISVTNEKKEYPNPVWMAYKKTPRWLLMLMEYRNLLIELIIGYQEEYIFKELI